jgi:hypothetical protein
VGESLSANEEPHVKRIRSAHTRATAPAAAAESACCRDAETKPVTQKLRDRAGARVADLRLLCRGGP